MAVGIRRDLPVPLEVELAPGLEVERVAARVGLAEPAQQRVVVVRGDDDALAIVALRGAQEPGARCEFVVDALGAEHEHLFRVDVVAAAVMVARAEIEQVVEELVARPQRATSESSVTIAHWRRRNPNR
jgi:hypothetical protein